MAGRHSAKQSKLPVVIVCLIIVVILVIAGIIIFLNFNKSADNQSTTNTSTTQPLTTVESIVEQQTQEQDIQATTALSQQTTAGNDSSSTSQVVVVPTDSSDDDKSYFNATFAAYQATDAETGEACTLKEVFGSSYTGGTITFNSDGTFSDTLSSSSVNSGAYVIEGNSVKATYTNDKNMNITVTQWNDDGTPAEFTVNYGGYNVSFN